MKQLITLSKTEFLKCAKAAYETLFNQKKNLCSIDIGDAILAEARKINKPYTKGYIEDLFAPLHLRISIKYSKVPASWNDGDLVPVKISTDFSTNKASSDTIKRWQRQVIFRLKNSVKELSGGKLKIKSIDEFGLKNIYWKINTKNKIDATGCVTLESETQKK